MTRLAGRPKQGALHTITEQIIESSLLNLSLLAIGGDVLSLMKRRSRNQKVPRDPEAKYTPEKFAIIGTFGTNCSASKAVRRNLHRQVTKASICWKTHVRVSSFSVKAREGKAQSGKKRRR